MYQPIRGKGGNLGFRIGKKKKKYKLGTNVEDVEILLSVKFR